MGDPKFLNSSSWEQWAIHGFRKSDPDWFEKNIDVYGRVDLWSTAMGSDPPEIMVINKFPDDKNLQLDYDVMKTYVQRWVNDGKIPFWHATGGYKYRYGDHLNLNVTKYQVMAEMICALAEYSETC